MKKSILLLFWAGAAIACRATHITGGEMFYVFTGISNGQYQYSVTLKLYQRCNSGRQFPNPTIISIFNKTNNARVTDLSIPITETENISIGAPDPCITNPPPVCYDVAYYVFQVSLMPSAQGYLLASQVNYRINGITNLLSGQVGATYTADIPGSSGVTNAQQNHSANFVGSDLVIVCANNNFSYSFAAEDADGDQLRYSFCGAYNSTNSSGGAAMPTLPPPFPQVPYNSPGFSEQAPLGGMVRIDPNNGLITGVAPPEGIYVVTVCVEEMRNGQVIAVQRKDLQIHIAPCELAAANLFPEYQLCRNTQTITIANQANHPLILTYRWDLFDRSGAIIYTTSTPTITYTFPDTGIYRVKLVINPGQPCTDSTTARVRVYPGFNPAFTSSGICYTKPTYFTDQSSSVYGAINSWNWDFGEVTRVIDIASIPNPVYTYPAMGTKTVRLIVTDTKGCKDSVFQIIQILDKPPVGLLFRDTLICVNDQVQIQAAGNGVYSWSPVSYMTNANTSSPTVAPPVTTTYYVDLDDNGCKNRDSVKVRVVDRVSLQVMPDTSICSGDTIRLRVFSDGFQYYWSPAVQLVDPTVKNPLAITPATTTYTVRAVIGGCSATDEIVVRAVPYPLAYAGPDTAICYNTPAQLQAITDGSNWVWTPTGSLVNPTALNPVAHPARTTAYIFSAFDNRGCPKPGRDTILVSVYPKMQVDAGNDTALVLGQPLQLNGSGGETYAWSPPNYLSGTSIANPVAQFTAPSPGFRYKLVASSAFGCLDSAFITIKVFATGPSIFVPTAFTPNNDGRNDILRPIGAGIRQLLYFRVYNRWGQMLYSTSVAGQGWDGRINGQHQGSNTYVWMASAIDYNGNPYFSKGVVTLIR